MARKLTLVIDEMASAFDPDPREEVARILRMTASLIQMGRLDGPLHDREGNKVGSYQLEFSPEP